jgi:glutathione-regulated potassium-efflux system ancillary protein KefC
MVCTPFLMIVHDRWIEPRFRCSARGTADTIPPGEDHVIIAGYGRVGQIIGRMLAMNQVKTTLLEHDPDQVELVRKFGAKVFYGDATRPDLLHAAGAAKARVLVVAVDDIDDSLKLVDMARREFPGLAIVARARNVTHYYDLLDRGVEVIERETFESSLLLGRHALEKLGFGAWHARQLAQRFKLWNIQSLMRVYPHYKNQEQYLSASKQAREELEAMMAQDAKLLQEERKGGGWE